MNQQEHLNALSDIRNLMERSSRFLSLSGLSGIFIGFYALVGAAAAWWYLDHASLEITSDYDLTTSAAMGTFGQLLVFLVVDALLVLCISLITGYILSQRLARKQGLNVWDPAAKRLVINLFIPLIAGGIYCLILLQHQHLDLIAPSMLIFYGLALLNAGKYTYNDIRYLGVVEIILGLLAAFYTGYGLQFWAFGFGVMHIVYGITIYYKYER